MVTIDKSQLAWFVGLITCICGALVGQAELLGEPTRHYVTMAFVVGTALTGYMMQPKRDSFSRTRADDPPPPNGEKP